MRVSVALWCLVVVAAVCAGAAVPSGARPVDSQAKIPSPGQVVPVGRAGSLDQQLLVSLANGHLVALDEDTGELQWSFDTGSPLLTSANPAAAAAAAAAGDDPEVDPATLPALKEGIFPGTDGSLYVYRPQKTGPPRIEKLPVGVRDLVDLSPAPTPDGSLVLGSQRTSVFVLDAARGTLLRTLRAADGDGGEDLLADPEVLGEPGAAPGAVLAIGRKDYVIRAVHPAFGEQWNVSWSSLQHLSSLAVRRNTAGAGEALPSAVEPMQLIVGPDHSLRRVDTEKGWILWSQRFEAPPLAAYPAAGPPLDLVDAFGASGQEDSSGSGSRSENDAGVLSGLPNRNGGGGSGATGAGAPLPPGDALVVGVMRGGLYGMKVPGLTLPTGDPAATALIAADGGSGGAAGQQCSADGDEAGGGGFCGVGAGEKEEDFEVIDRSSSGDGAAGAAAGLSGSELDEEDEDSAEETEYELFDDASTAIALTGNGVMPLAVPWWREQVCSSPGGDTCAVPLGLFPLQGESTDSDLLFLSDLKGPAAGKSGSGAADAPAPAPRRSAATRLAIWMVLAVEAHPTVFLLVLTAGGWAIAVQIVDRAWESHHGPGSADGKKFAARAARVAWAARRLAAKEALFALPAPPSPPTPPLPPAAAAAEETRNGSPDVPTAKKPKKTKKKANGGGNSSSNGDAAPAPAAGESASNGTSFQPSKDQAEQAAQQAQQAQQRGSVVIDGITHVGRLRVGPAILGYGSGGTIVFEGELDGRSVAVKRLLRQFVDLARKEIAALIVSDEHPSVVRCFAMEEDAEFVYLALERCSGTLADAMGSPQGRSKFVDAEGRPTAYALRVSEDVGRGLEALHARGIVHRDLKPHNVLIAENGRAKLSDMGLSKTLLTAEASFETLGHAGGSPGWQAPEQLALRAGNPGARQTAAVDVFSFGLLIHYCLTGGKHPYGEGVERDAAILRGRRSLAAIQGLPEAEDLLQAMLEQRPEARPAVAAAMAHPLWWDAPRRLEFLIHVSDRVEGEDRAGDSKMYAGLEALSPGVVGPGGSWAAPLDPGLLSNLGKYRRYDFGSLRDLLRVVRNKHSHFRELPPELQSRLGPIPDGFLSYFSIRFPRLLVSCFYFALRWCPEEPVFAKYFSKEALGLLRTAAPLEIRDPRVEAEAMEAAKIRLAAAAAEARAARAAELAAEGGAIASPGAAIALPPEPVAPPVAVLYDEPSKTSVMVFPRRPGQPNCEFYVKTGHCRYGESCKYDHPPEYSVRLSSAGLPLRPGQPVCTFYERNGDCKFGPACRFHHPPLPGVPLRVAPPGFGAGPR